LTRHGGFVQDIDVLVSEIGPREGLRETRQLTRREYRKQWIGVMPGEPLYRRLAQARLSRRHAAAGRP
jgi:hypothetical protein